MPDQIRLTGTEYRLIAYLRDQDKSRRLADIAEGITTHPSYVSRLISKLSGYGLVSVGRSHKRLSIEVIENL